MTRKQVTILNRKRIWRTCVCLESRLSEKNAGNLNSRHSCGKHQLANNNSHIKLISCSVIFSCEWRCTKTFVPFYCNNESFIIKVTLHLHVFSPWIKMWQCCRKFLGCQFPIPATDPTLDMLKQYSLDFNHQIRCAELFFPLTFLNFKFYYIIGFVLKITLAGSIDRVAAKQFFWKTA